jgi:hypothetical protein
MKLSPWLFGLLAAVTISGCGGGAREDTGATGDPGTETGTMQGGTTTDTTATPGTGGAMSDTAHGGTRMHDDTAKAPPAGAEGDTARTMSDTGAQSGQY